MFSLAKNYNFYSVPPQDLADFFGNGEIERLQSLLQSGDERIGSLVEQGALTDLLALADAMEGGL